MQGKHNLIIENSMKYDHGKEYRNREGDSQVPIVKALLYDIYQQ
jgi:hypothetical protein